MFVVAGAAKLADLPGSRAAVAGFGVPERLARPIGTLLPFAELATAVALLPAATARAGAVSALVLLLGFSAGIAASIARGESPDCHCFGQLHSAPAGAPTLARNLALAALAGFVVVAGDDAGPGLIEAIGDLDSTAALAIGLGLAVCLLLAAGTGAYLQLLRQHGGLLLRVDALEGALRSHGIPIPSAAPAPSAPGLPVGSAAPEFSLPGLHGETVTLASLRAAGRPVLLVFTDPGCGPCKALLPQLGEWRREHAERLAIALISRDDAERIRAEAAEHEVAPVLAEGDRTVSQRYRAPATPSAVLVDRSGRIASAVAAGEPAIAAVVEVAVSDPLDVVMVPAAPPVALGDPLPKIPGLRDLDGDAVDLADALGDAERIVLLWDPACGFCRRMLDDLRRLESASPAAAEALLVISRGEAEANREQGLRAPILLDEEGFALGRALGARGTPSAIRVDAQGRVASEVAVGAEAVLALLRARTDV